MPETTLTPDTSFAVKEDVALNFLIAGLCYTFSAISLFSSGGSYIDYFAIPFFLGPAIFFTVKGMKNKTVILINRRGIFYLGKLITNWDNFYNAYIKEEEKLGRVSDNFVLFVKCYNEIKGDYIERKIKLSNTQSKSEEAIITAIKYYSRLAKNSAQ